MAQAMRRCSICKTLFPAGRRNRKTCSDECRVKLAVKHDQERQLQIVSSAAVKANKPESICGIRTQVDTSNQLALIRSLRVIQRPINHEPRRKCPVCCQFVRLVNSVAGAVWLRPHKLNGHPCDGSRAVVCYPNERKYYDE